MVVLLKSCCNRAILLNSYKVVVFGESGCILARVVVFGQSGLYSGKSGCIGEKVVVFG